jgi:hypothetical protein
VGEVPFWQLSFFSSTFLCGRFLAGELGWHTPGQVLFWRCPTAILPTRSRYYSPTLAMGARGSFFFDFFSFAIAPIAEFI